MGIIMEIINNVSKLVLDIDRCIDCLRVQDMLNASNIIKSIIQSVSNVLEANADFLTENDISDINDTLKSLLDTLQNKDYVLLADVLEMQLLPIFTEICQSVVAETCAACGQDYIEGEFFDKNVGLISDDKLSSMITDNAERLKNHPELSAYHAEATNLGVNTLKYESDEKSYYFHSNVNPFKEGKSFANYYADDKCLNYLVFGFGMGYHVEALLQHDRRFNVTVIETNADILTLAFMHRDLSNILSDENFNLIYTSADEINKIINSHENYALILHYPSLMSLPDGSLKDALTDYYVKLNSSYTNERFLNFNFYYNMKRNDAPADDVLEKLAGKSVIFVAGGPSLRDHLQYLKNVQKDKIIITASTSYRLLIENGISPDFVFMIDPMDVMKKHVSGIPAGRSSLIYLCTASRFAVNEFQGQHFIAFQNGYEPAEEFAKKHNYTLIDTGGSVSTAAIDFILRSGCDELITFGLDLAYTDNKLHSFDESSNIADSDATMEMTGIDGKPIKTSRMFSIFRKWIESRLRLEKRDISLINVSRGVPIEGMKNITTI
jgi:hypothetical protein